MQIEGKKREQGIACVAKNTEGSTIYLHNIFTYGVERVEPINIDLNLMILRSLITVINFWSS